MGGQRVIRKPDDRVVSDAEVWPVGTGRPSWPASPAVAQPFCYRTSIRPQSEREPSCPPCNPPQTSSDPFRDDPYDGPVAQVNLLKFRVEAEYGPDEPEHGVDEPGSVAYRRYVEAFQAAAAEVGGSCLLYGDAERYFIGRGDWDAVLIMHFPSRAAFIQTLNHPDYHEMHRHRAAGLLCQDLLTTRPTVTALDD